MNDASSSPQNSRWKAVLLLGLLAIGAFPPSIAPQPVERTIPAERFSPRN